ncbi:hypothetical protein FVEN_g5500 [Fusarium venenatum]|nr:hypothetical protein FVEN_g5500 [Fusarium venenatum]KAH6965190.1 hypothetical protein EDB82DRAFT_511849 [Fusarium venenatum]
MAVPVGELKYDRPLDARQRYAEVTRQNKPKKRIYANAWLEVQLQDLPHPCGLKRIWRDGLGHLISGEHVRYKDGITDVEAITRACINWDQAERNRCRNYNSQLIVTLARLQIIEFAKAGTSENPKVPADLKVNRRLMLCRLISDDIHKLVTSWNNLAESLEKLDLGRPYQIM